MLNSMMETRRCILPHKTDTSSQNKRTNTKKKDQNLVFCLSVFRSIRILLNFGANPFVENRCGESSWNLLTKLDETKQFELLHLFNEFDLKPPINLIFNSIDENLPKIFDFLLSQLYEDLKIDSASLSRLLRTSLRSSNTVLMIFFVERKTKSNENLFFSALSRMSFCNNSNSRISPIFRPEQFYFGRMFEHFSQSKRSGW